MYVSVSICLCIITIICTYLFTMYMCTYVHIYIYVLVYTLLYIIDTCTTNCVCIYQGIGIEDKMWNDSIQIQITNASIQFQ